MQSASKQFSKILLTGMQPTGSLHIGNYLGSISNVLRHQYQGQYDRMYLMLADYHSLTVALNYDHSVMSFNNAIGSDSFKMAKTLLACGVDPEKITLFVQSQVPQHFELAWILNCICPQHWLKSMIQYKEKADANSSIGLYTYPILMAADILMYRATHVPVGVDQLQHLYLANKIANRFNSIFTPFFNKIEYVYAKMPKVMSLNDPKKKMSKSDPNPRSRIHLADTPEEVREKIRKAISDSLGTPLTYDPEKREGLGNLLLLYCEVLGTDLDTFLQEAQRTQMTIPQFKDLLIYAITTKLQHIQQNEYKIPDNQVHKVLAQGAYRARSYAIQTINLIKYQLNIYK